MPSRPSWDCLGCGQPWPCAPAKVRLAEEYGRQRVNLSAFMARQLHDALPELSGVSSMVLHERFLWWTR